MRIGMLVDVYKPHISGITNYIVLTKKILEDYGHEVFVFTFGNEDYEDDEPNIIRSPGLPLLDTGYYLSLNYNKPARALLRTMDIVHVHHPFVSGTLALRLCKPRGIPIVFTNHTRYDLYAQAYLPGVPNVIGETALQTYLPAFCRSCDLVVAPSAGMRDVLREIGVDSPVEVVPNGVQLDRFKQAVDPIDRQEFGLSPEDILFLYLGRLGPEKNLPFLLRAIAGSVQAFENIRLLLIGSGPELENLQDRVEHMKMGEYIRFLGQVDYEQVPRYLAMVDVFVTASVTEVHPLSVIEAMAAGLPVLGMISPGISDTIQDKQTGFLVKPDDLAGFTAKLIRLAIDKRERLAMGRRAQEAADDYAIERTTQLIFERYQYVVRTASRKGTLRNRVIRWMDELRG